MKNENYPLIEQQLRDYRINKGLLAAQIGQRLPSPVISHLTSRATDAQSKNAPTEQQALRLAEISEQLADKAWYVGAIDDLLSIASPEEKTLLEARYFKPQPLTAWQVANELFISRTEYYRRRDLLLDWLEKRMGLAVLKKEA